MDILVYCINLPRAMDKAERMVDRFHTTGFNNVHFVQAASADSGLVEHYTKGMQSWYEDEHQFRKDIGCFASHMLALRMFLATEQPCCLVCEDDVMFHNKFTNLFRDLLDNLPQDAPVLSLSYMISNYVDQTYVYKSPRIALEDIHHGIWKIDPTYTWGTQCYYITKNYARQIIDEFDHPMAILCRTSELAKHMLENDQKITSEIILRTSNGYMSAVPLVIEDCISSCRAPQDLPYHMRHFCRWDWCNYNNCDPDEQSPLISMKPGNAWEGYPFKLDIHTKTHSQYPIFKSVFCFCVVVITVAALYKTGANPP